jgi:hypothetical protein
LNDDEARVTTFETLGESYPQRYGNEEKDIDAGGLIKERIGGDKTARSAGVMG